MNSDQTKSVADFLIADFENEMQATMRVIEAVPNVSPRLPAGLEIQDRPRTRPAHRS